MKLLFRFWLGIFSLLLSVGGGLRADDAAPPAPTPVAAPSPTPCLAPPKFTVGDGTVIPVKGKKTWYINDSAFPFLPDKAGTGRVAFWGDGCVIRYAGADIDHLMPPTDSATVVVTDAPGTDGAWHQAGGWMLTATRIDDGSLVGFVHGENHKFPDGGYGEWNSTGVWTSHDDGVTWVNQGEVVGSQKPEKHTFGGMAMNECIWDAANKRWLGYAAGGDAFVSYDSHGMPGTWLGYYHGDFTQKIDVNGSMPPLTPAPGLEKAWLTWGGLTYNSYLKQYVLTWVGGKSVRAVFSSDGVHWGPVVNLIDEATAGGAITYAFIAGDTDTASAQDCTLIYMLSHPKGVKSVSGNNKDMIRRPLHFEL